MTSNSKLVLALLATTLIAVGCGGGKTTPATATPTALTSARVTPAPSQPQLVIVSSDVAVGPNRFVLGLLDAQGALVKDAQLHLSFVKLNTAGQPEGVKGETDARTLTVQKDYVATRSDGTLETRSAGSVTVYVAQAQFDVSGSWGGGGARCGSPRVGPAPAPPLPVITAAFDVGDRTKSVPIGQAAPRTRQLVLKDVGDIAKIDTSNPANPEMHNLTIADAVSSGRATVIVFATPAFCMSQTCGPVKETVDQLYAKYKGQANFIHVEPYDVVKARDGKGLDPVPAMQEWGLETEPWVFVVERHGGVAAKFEGVVSFDELEAALKPVIGG